MDAQERPSAVDALRCARAIQEALALLTCMDAQMPRAQDAQERPGADEQFAVRIGLHIGDVVFEGSDVFGDGVNVASRIEALAPPGGIAMSGQFHSAVRGQRDLVVHSLGEKTLKNIEQPVTVFVLGEATTMQPRKGDRFESVPFLSGIRPLFASPTTAFFNRFDCRIASPIMTPSHYPGRPYEHYPL